MHGSGSASMAISNRYVALLHAAHGRGPHQARTVIADELVLCIARGGLNPQHAALTGAGAVDHARRQRDALRATVIPDLRNYVETVLERSVLLATGAGHEDPLVDVVVLMLA